MMMNRILIASLLLVTFVGLRAQETERPVIRPVSFFVGLQPGINLAGYDDYGRPLINVNLLPVTFEYAINRHLGFRINPVWELQIRPEFPTELSTVGAEIAIPYYFSKKNSEEGQRGFYGAGVVTPAFYRLNNYYSLGVALEAGYAILFGHGWSLTLAGQAGVKIQAAQNNPFIRYLPYTAPRLAVGYWF